MVVQAEAAGSVMQEAIVERVAGRVAAALYVPVQAVAVGSVMQDLIGVKSPLKELTRAGRLVAAV